MSSLHIAFAVAAAVLVFWIVGAYNRLVSLRSEVAKTFTPVELQLRQRNALLDSWLAAVKPLLDQALQSIDAVAAACGQVAAALDVLCRQPLLAAPAATVRLAESTLADARLRLQAELPPALAQAPVSSMLPLPVQAPARSSGDSADPSPALAPAQAPEVILALAAEALSGSDAALNFARSRFNEASGHYNAARHQFPTWLVAALFGFRPAGSL